MSIDDEGNENTGTEIPGEAEAAAAAAAAAEAEAAGAGDDDTPPEPTEVEQIAIEQGWAPEDQWRGDPAKWVDAATFVRQGPEILKRTLRNQDGQLETMKETMDRMANVQDSIVGNAYDRGKADLQAAQRRAVEEGDTDAFDAATAQLTELDEQRPEPAAAAGNGAAGKTTPDDDPNFIAFQTANPWYGADGDPEMTLAAEDAAKVIGRKYAGQDFYERISEHIMNKFPNYQADDGGGGSGGGPKKTTQRRTARVDGGSTRTPSGPGGGKGSGQNYKDLPAEAKEACDRFVANGDTTKEAYCKEYFTPSGGEAAGPG